MSIRERSSNLTVLKGGKLRFWPIKQRMVIKMPLSMQALRSFKYYIIFTSVRQGCVNTTKLF
jgi:hypothetical protein